MPRLLRDHTRAFHSVGDDSIRSLHIPIQAFVSASAHSNALVEKAAQSPSAKWQHPYPVRLADAFTGDGLQKSKLRYRVTLQQHWRIGSHPEIQDRVFPLAASRYQSETALAA